MLVELLVNFVFTIMNFFAVLINLPSFPDSVDTYVSRFFDYLKIGIAVLANYVDMSYLLTLFSLFLSIVVCVDVYR